MSPLLNNDDNFSLSESVMQNLEPQINNDKHIPISKLTTNYMYLFMYKLLKKTFKFISNKLLIIKYFYLLQQFNQIFLP